jgi:hypothetical protein
LLIGPGKWGWRIHLTIAVSVVFGAFLNKKTLNAYFLWVKKLALKPEIFNLWEESL